ncbi:MAG: MFS transporter [Alphaproteobacteria bacterium]|nr:MFS transporter [Alphaproteobacteria bacterium]
MAEIAAPGTEPIDLAGAAATRRAILACSIGQVFEIFDFVIYAYFAAAIGRAFFPSSDPFTSLLGSFATFGVGFIMRPVGAVAIGYYGDRFGRRKALVVTIGLMAIATGLTGLAPTYAASGILGPLILVACRLLQGFSTGGEWGGAAAFLVEYAPAGRRGLIGSYQQAATAIGAIAAALSAAILSSILDPESFNSWGWRLPFILGFVLGPIGYYLRTRVAETPAFERTAAARQIKRMPLRDALTTHGGVFAAAFGLSIIGCVLNYTFIVFMPSFAAQTLKIDMSHALYSAVFANVVYLVLTPIVGGLSDKLGRKVMMFACSALSFVFAYPLFLLLVSIPTIWGLVLVQAIAAAILTLYTGVISTILSEMFPTNVRYTALSTSYGFAVAIFGGFAPAIATFLMKLTGDPMSPAYYVMAAGLVSGFAVLFVEERARAAALA